MYHVVEHQDQVPLTETQISLQPAKSMTSSPVEHLQCVSVIGYKD
jgi:hypothetical protein